MIRTAGDVEIWPLDELEAEQEDELAACDVIVDALYGTGFHGALRPNGLRAAALINRAAGLVCALDLPSGVNADTGETAQGAVQAGVTITFHARKQGQNTPAAAAHCGEIVMRISASAPRWKGKPCNPKQKGTPGGRSFFASNVFYFWQRLGKAVLEGDNAVETARLAVLDIVPMRTNWKRSPSFAPPSDGSSLQPVSF